MQKMFVGCSDGGPGRRVGPGVSSGSAARTCAVALGMAMMASGISGEAALALPSLPALVEVATLA